MNLGFFMSFPFEIDAEDERFCHDKIRLLLLTSKQNSRLDSQRIAGAGQRSARTAARGGGISQRWRLFCVQTNISPDRNLSHERGVW